MTDLAEEAVEAIGRCALAVPSAASETCLATLVKIISDPNAREEIVCVAVVVLKRLLHSEAPLNLLKKVSRLMENVKVCKLINEILKYCETPFSRAIFYPGVIGYLTIICKIRVILVWVR